MKYNIGTYTASTRISTHAEVLATAGKSSCSVSISHRKIEYNQCSLVARITIKLETRPQRQARPQPQVGSGSVKSHPIITTRHNFSTHSNQSTNMPRNFSDDHTESNGRANVLWGCHGAVLADVGSQIGCCKDVKNAGSCRLCVCSFMKYTNTATNISRGSRPFLPPAQYLPAFQSLNNIISAFVSYPDT